MLWSIISWCRWSECGYVMSLYFLMQRLSYLLTTAKRFAAHLPPCLHRGCVSMKWGLHPRQCQAVPQMKQIAGKRDDRFLSLGASEPVQPNRLAKQDAETAKRDSHDFCDGSLACGVQVNPSSTSKLSLRFGAMIASNNLFHGETSLKKTLFFFFFWRWIRYIFNAVSLP